MLTVTLREGYSEEQQQRFANEMAANALGLEDEEGDDDEEGGKPAPAKGKGPVGGKKPGLKVEKIVVKKNGKIANLADDVLIEMAKDWADHSAGRREFEDYVVSAMSTLIKTLDGPTRRLFNAQVATLISNPQHDPAGTSELLDCATAALAAPHPEGCDCGDH